MRIVGRGRKQRGWSVTTACDGRGNGGGGCGAQLLIEQADLFKTTSHAMGETTDHVTFKCQECGVLTDLERDSHPPADVLSNLKIKNPG